MLDAHKQTSLGQREKCDLCSIVVQPHSSTTSFVLARRPSSDPKILCKLQQSFMHGLKKAFIDVIVSQASALNFFQSPAYHSFAGNVERPHSVVSFTQQTIFRQTEWA